MSETLRLTDKDRDRERKTERMIDAHMDRCIGCTARVIRE